MDMLQPMRDARRLFADQVVAPADYIVFSDGGVAYLKNGRTGAIEYSSTDHGSVVQEAINSARDYGMIYVVSPLTISTITVSKPLHMVFTSTITPVPDHDTVVVTSSDVKIEGLKIVGGGSGYRLKIHAGVGIENRIKNIVLRDIIIDGAGQAGMGLYINNANSIFGNNILSIGNGDGGAHIIDSADITFTYFAVISNGGSFGARLAGCANVNLFSPLFDSSSGDGLVLYASIETKIFGGITLYNNGNGINIGNYNYDVQLYGHKIKNNSGDGLVINNPDGSGVLLHGVMSHNNGGYGFNIISGGSVYLLNTNAWANAGGNINNVAGAVIRDSPFFTNSNGGSAVFSGDGSTTQFAIPHGLTAVPSKVVVTPASADASGQFYVTVDASNIYVNYATAPPAGTDNIVLYWYAEV